ncbi:MAG: ubiquinone/menaquinone biosynthesis C-methylase UbiE [Saprospiraceae bacterium]|jgi:ubiquinone/menaquinone biosynthesis C-methylase UbiE
MKIYKLTFLLSTCLLLLIACDDGYNGGNYNEQSQSHNYDSTPGYNGNDIQASPGQHTSNVGDNTEVRDIWQNYRVVINKLGDLTGKVVADIGAGPYGYFTLRIANNSDIKKIIAIDIDKESVKFIEDAKIFLKKNVRDRIETRLVEPHDPNLKEGEADLVLIVNTYTYFENPEAYLINVKRGIAKDGKLVIIDFKKRNTPVGPPVNYRTAIGKVEQDLTKAGYTNIESDDQTLEYQYIIIAQPGLDN